MTDHDPLKFSFERLAVWHTKLPDVKHAQLPPGNTRPNPLAVDDLIFVSIFAPGAICALRRHDGALLWRRELGELGGASVYCSDGYLFAQSPTTLYCLHPDSGRVEWSFSPCGKNGETMYSSPCVRDGRVYIGDRSGFLHCLDIRKGKKVWKQLTNDAKNHDVNSTPLVVDGLVIVSTNAAAVVAYDAVTGKAAWRCDIDGPSTFGPLLFEDTIAVLADSLYVLEPTTGSIRQRFKWDDGKISFAESSDRHVIGGSIDQGSSKLVLIGAEGIYSEVKLGGSCTSLRYSTETRFLYVSHYEGVDLCCAESGETKYRLSSGDERGGELGPVDVRGPNIYALTWGGDVYSLQHPTPELALQSSFY